ncbi:hypothetical protein [Nitrospira sp. BLG_1]|uniref:hypothetical protein n=1 Tax=Nitrospira sp. BLG_1 TaxID=3395883 RepID=UPI0039BC73E7
MRDSNNQPIWNIYLEKTIGGYRIIMPEWTGEMKAKCPQDGIAMSWPVNPHFTGKEGIIEILQGYEKFKNVQFC